MNERRIVALDGLGGTWERLEPELRSSLPGCLTARMDPREAAFATIAHPSTLVLASAATAVDLSGLRQRLGAPVRMVVVAAAQTEARRLLACVDAGAAAIAPLHRPDRIIACLKGLGHSVSPCPERNLGTRFVVLVDAEGSQRARLRMGLKLPRNCAVVGAQDLKETIWQLAQCSSGVAAVVVGRSQPEQILRVARQLVPQAWTLTLDSPVDDILLPQVDFDFDRTTSPEDLSRLLAFLSGCPRDVTTAEAAER